MLSDNQEVEILIMLCSFALLFNSMNCNLGDIAGELQEIKAALDYDANETVEEITTVGKERN